MKNASSAVYRSNRDRLRSSTSYLWSLAMAITESGWGMPLELWVQAAHAKFRVKEVGVPRLYLDPNRAFGGVLNDAEQRLAYYRDVIARAEARFAACDSLPDVLAGCCLLMGCTGNRS